MAFLPPAQANGSKETSGVKKSPGGFLSSLKKIFQPTVKAPKNPAISPTKNASPKLDSAGSKEAAKPFLTTKVEATVSKPNLSIAKADPELSETEAIKKTAAVPQTYQRPSLQASQPLVAGSKPEIKKTLSDNNPLTVTKNKNLPTEALTKSTIAKTPGADSWFKKLINSFSHGSLVKKLAQERQLEESTKNKTEVESRFWQPYNGVKANLVKGQEVSFFNWQQKMLTMSLSLVLCCLVISLAYVGLLIWQKEKLNDNKDIITNYDAINNEVAKSENDLKDITAFNKKLGIVSFVLDNHVYWTNFFDFLENSTLKDVYFEGFTGDLTGEYKIPAVARNLDAISLQLEVMKSFNSIKGIQYSSSQNVAATDKSPAVIKFSLEMSIDPKVFIK